MEFLVKSQIQKGPFVCCRLLPSTSKHDSLATGKELAFSLSLTAASWGPLAKQTCCAPSTTLKRLSLAPRVVVYFGQLTRGRLFLFEHLRLYHNVSFS